MPVHLLVSESLVSEGVEAHEGDPDVSGRHPALKIPALVKVVRTWGDEFTTEVIQEQKTLKYAKSIRQKD